MHMWNQWFSHFKQLAVTWEACLSGHTGSGNLEQLQDFLFPINHSHDANAAGLWEMILVSRLPAKWYIGLYCGGKGRNEEDVLSPFSHIRLFVTRLLCPWGSPGKNTVVGCHALLQGIFPTQGSNLHLLCVLHSLPLAPRMVKRLISGCQERCRIYIITLSKWLVNCLKGEIMQNFKTFY